MKREMYIKNINGEIIFSFEKEENCLKNMVEEAVRRGVNLRNADLRYADLCGADLKGANLVGADLRSALLYGADLK